MAATKACRPQEGNSGQGSKGCYAVMHYMQSKILGCIVSYELFGNNIPTSLSVTILDYHHVIIEVLELIFYCSLCIVAQSERW